MAAGRISEGDSRRLWVLVDELATGSFLETSLVTFDFGLSKDRGIKSSGRGLACGRRPVALGGHRLNQRLAIHGLARLLEDLGGGVQSAQFTASARSLAIGR